MAVSSKILKTIDTSCHEFMHPWVGSCSDASAGVLIHSIQASFRIYVTTYMVFSLYILKYKFKKIGNYVDILFLS